MKQGFSVNAGVLSTGGQEIAGLAPSLESVTSHVFQAVNGMAGSASGHAGLTSALTSAAHSSSAAFVTFGVAYQHIGGMITEIASIYEQAERASVVTVSRDGGGQ